jgi:hypothetical protein
MRTKALLLGAVIGALTLATSNAQVYSVNIVGYVNVTIPAGPAFKMIQNPLDCKVAGGNTIANIWATPPNAVTIYQWDPTTVPPRYKINNYDVDFGWDNPDTLYAPGEGFFVYNPVGAPSFNVTFVGDVMTGDLSLPVYTGFTMAGSKVPQAGLMQSELNYVPGPEAESIYFWDPTAVPPRYKITTWDSDFLWDPGEPQLNVGDAVFIYRPAPSTKAWTRTFNVQ